MSKEENNLEDLNADAFEIFTQNDENPTFTSKMKRDLPDSLSDIAKGALDSKKSIFLCSAVLGSVAAVITNSTGADALTMFAGATTAVTAYHGASHIFRTAIDNTYELLLSKFSKEEDKKVLMSNDIKNLDIHTAIDIREKLQEKGYKFEDDEKFEGIKQKFANSEKNERDKLTGSGRSVAVDSALRTGFFR